MLVRSSREFKSSQLHLQHARSDWKEYIDNCKICTNILYRRELFFFFFFLQRTYLVKSKLYTKTYLVKSKLYTNKNFAKDFLQNMFPRPNFCKCQGCCKSHSWGCPGVLIALLILLLLILNYTSFVSNVNSTKYMKWTNRISILMLLLFNIKHYYIVYVVLWNCAQVTKEHF